MCLPICNIRETALLPQPLALFQATPSTKLMSDVTWNTAVIPYSQDIGRSGFLYGTDGSFLKHMLIAAHPAFLSNRGLGNLLLAYVYMAFPN